jgi:hypothetical protein
MAAMALVACSGDTQTAVPGGGDPDIEAARAFDRFPLYWVGEHFEGWDLEHVDVTTPRHPATFIYGTCELPVPADGGCAPPLQLQIAPLCTHLEVVYRYPIGERQIRGAPVGTSRDDAPVLLTNRVQVKVYSGQGATRGIAYRALQALRSVNDVPPVIDADDPIPAPPRAVQEGESCSR